NNTVGGTAAGAGNVISGNTQQGVLIENSGTTGVLVAGNFIGTNATGTSAIANGTEGIQIDSGASGNTIGGLTATPGTGAGNVISGNTQDGVYIEGSNSNTIAGNLVGTNAAGTGAIPNGGVGVIVSDSTGNTVGGTTDTARNIISGNASDGIEVAASSSSVAG